MAVSPLDVVTMPPRIAVLPRDHRGYPVPFFVQWSRDGVPLFPIFDPHKYRRCVTHNLCWLCGQPLARNVVFVVGPMCTINRISSEPPSHLDCTTYGLRVCPFMVNPAMRRVPTERFGEVQSPAGIMDEGNPGVMAQWLTREYKITRLPNGPLIDMGDPSDVFWWTRGRFATSQEAANAMQAGAAKLGAVAAEHEGASGVAFVAKQLRIARGLLPDPSLLQVAA
jgi:hypothetical protein